MARQQHRLSALKVAKLTKPGLYGDGGGLTLQITTTGAKSWLFRYMVAGKPFGMGLGPTHTVSLTEARQKVLEGRKLLLDGVNPLVAKKQNRIDAALVAAYFAERDRSFRVSVTDFRMLHEQDFILRQSVTLSVKSRSRFGETAVTMA